jgi:hypothetical protein
LNDQPSSERRDIDPVASKHPMVHDRVTESDLDESLQMLKTRVGQVNAVFACFGSAAQHAQQFEAALAEFLSDYNKLSKRAVTPQEFEVLDQKLQKRTLGTLLREFSRYVTIEDPKVVGFLEMALERRNFLMHHFFREREDRLRLEKDRMDLLSELVGIDRVLEKAATIIRGMRIAVTEAISDQKQAGERSEKGDSERTKVVFTATVKMPDDPQDKND